MFEERDKPRVLLLCHYLTFPPGPYLLNHQICKLKTVHVTFLMASGSIVDRNDVFPDSGDFNFFFIFINLTENGNVSI